MRCCAISSPSSSTSRSNWSGVSAPALFSLVLPSLTAQRGSYILPGPAFPVKHTLRVRQDAVVLHADPCEDVIDGLEGREARVQAGKVPLVFALVVNLLAARKVLLLASASLFPISLTYLALSGNLRLDRLEARLRSLAQLEQPVDLLVVALDKLGH